MEDTGPTITLPRRYRTKGVVLHELTHWALGIDSGLPHHGRTFARVLLDATAEFWGPEHAEVLATAYREQRVHVGKPPRRGPDGCLRYGWDERLRLGKGHVLTVAHTRRSTAPTHTVTARFEGYEHGSSVLRLSDTPDGDPVRLATNTVWDVRDD